MNKTSFRKTVQVNHTCYAFIGKVGTSDEARADKEVADRIARSLKADQEVELEDGSRQWIETEPIINMKKEGTDSYTWNDAETKVLHERVHHTLWPNGSKESKVLGTSYRNPFR